MSDMSGSGPLRIHHVESLDTPEASARIFQVTGFVKWFDVARGYGFIIPDNGAADVLLHLSCLKRDGYDAPLEGTRVTCEVVERQKGMQCLRVLAVDTSTAIHPAVSAKALMADTGSPPPLTRSMMLVTGSSRPALNSIEKPAPS